MVMSTSSIALSRKGNLVSTTAAEPTGQPRSGAGRRSRAPATSASEAFLRIPPFPGAKVQAFADAGSPNVTVDRAKALIELIRATRVGGSFWGAQPTLPSRYILTRRDKGSVPDQFEGAEPVVWSESSEYDPWHMLSKAAALVTDRTDPAAIIATILGVPVYSDEPGGARLLIGAAEALSSALSESCINPFTGTAMSVEEAIALCGYWRSLVDSNRDLAGGLGFAFWKQANVAPLLWGGAQPFEFLSSAADVPPGTSVAVWRSKAPAGAIERLERAGVPLVEIEDGFLRSQGLGADCVPPLSITVDRLGAYFDHAQPSELEQLLQTAEFNADTLERARRLRALIVESGIGKYGAGTSAVARPAGDRRHILVPGQVEDDRSVMTGGGGLSNLDLLKRARERAPDAYILYKPHPDVLAGHRKGAIPDRRCRELADEIVEDASVASLIDMADEIHVNTSLTGFEALMRGKAVTTYGVPFYAGWGLTQDLGPVPARRSRKRNLDELVAATLLVYPRYLDPVTGLPCPAEITVDRLCDGRAATEGLVVKLRRIQGKMVRGLRGVFP
jgi:capsular polysaccharide export protein